MRISDFSYRCSQSSSNPVSTAFWVFFKMPVLRHFEKYPEGPGDEVGALREAVGRVGSGYESTCDEYKADTDFIISLLALADENRK